MFQNNDVKIREVVLFEVQGPKVPLRDKKLTTFTSTTTDLTQQGRVSANKKMKQKAWVTCKSCKTSTSRNSFHLCFSFSCRFVFPISRSEEASSARGLFFISGARSAMAEKPAWQIPSFVAAKIDAKRKLGVAQLHTSEI